MMIAIDPESTNMVIDQLFFLPLLLYLEDSVALFIVSWCLHEEGYLDQYSN